MRHILCILFVYAITSCDNPSSGDQNQVNRNGYSTGDFLLEFDKAMEFEQGQLGKYEIIASVPEPGNVVLSVEGLPEGAVIEDGWLIFTPSCEALLTAGRYFRSYETFKFRITLTSDDDPESIVQDAGFILVHKHNDKAGPCGGSVE